MKSTELRGKKIAIGQITFTSIKTYHMLKQDGIEVSMFFDRDYRMQHRKYKNTPIFPWANFHDVYVILTSQNRYNELKKMLVNSCGYPEEQIILLDNIEFECSELDVSGEYDWTWLKNNVQDVSDAFIHYKSRILQKRLMDKNIPTSDLAVIGAAIGINNRCTLNCEYCAAQMPYYTPGEKRDYDIDNTIEKFDRFLDYMDYIPYLSILGGEPLLHPQLHKLVHYLNGKKAQEKIVHTDILTNGTLLLSDELIEAIKENPFFWKISVSPYGVHSKKQYELFKQLNEAGVPYYSRYMVYWQKFGQVTEPEDTGEEYIKNKCEHCACRVLQFEDGKIYRCQILPHFDLLRRIPYDERNFIDCSKPYGKKELLDFLRSYSPGMAYCNGNHQTFLQNENEKDAFGGDMIPVAEQAKGILPCKRYE
ncbi:MAG: radical SAM protein [Lachnospiraceae bacterium]